MARLKEGAMDSILHSVDLPHYEKAKTLVDCYRKEGFVRPELVLRNRLDVKMDVVKLTMEQTIDELYNEYGLNAKAGAA